MNLEEFLNENPAERVAYNKEIEAAKLEGKNEAHATFAKIEPFFNGEKTYPKSIMAHGFAALKGDHGADVFLGAVAAYDAAMEAQKSVTAQDETDENPETPSEQPETGDGIAKSAEDVAAMAKNDIGGMA